MERRAVFSTDKTVLEQQQKESKGNGAFKHTWTTGALSHTYQQHLEREQ